MFASARQRFSGSPILLVMTDIKRAIPSYMLFPENLNDHEWGARQVIAMKSKLFHPRYLPNLKSLVNVSHDIKPKRHFGFPAPRACHEEFKCGYSVAKTPTIADISWLMLAELYQLVWKTFVLISNGFFKLLSDYLKNVLS